MGGSQSSQKPSGDYLSRAQADQAYIDQAELDAYLKDYATQQYLQDYYTKTAADAATLNALAAYQPKGNYQPAGNYALKTDIPSLSGYARTSDLSDFVKADTTSLTNYLGKQAAVNLYQPKGNYLTQQALNSGLTMNQWDMIPSDYELCFKVGNKTVGCIDQDGEYTPIPSQLAGSDKFVTGRYVSIGFPNNVTGIINLFEMEVIDNRGAVVSYRKPVSGKNILPNNPGSNLTDIEYAFYKSRAQKNISTANTRGHQAAFVDSELVHTEGKDPGEYVEIDLGRPYNISFISIFNRGANNALADRIKGAQIIISTTPGRGNPVYTSDPITVGEFFIEVAPPSKTILRKHFDQHYGLT